MENTAELIVIMSEIGKLKATTEVQQGLIELCLGFISSKYGTDEYMKYLGAVKETKGFSNEAKRAASEQLKQVALWGEALAEGKKQ